MERKYLLTSLKIDGRHCDMTAGILSTHQNPIGRRSWDVVVRLALVDPRISGADMAVEMTTAKDGVFSGRVSLASVEDTGGDVSSRMEFRGSGPLTSPQPW